MISLVSTMMRSPEPDERRHQHADAVFEHRRLVGRSGGLALHDGIGLGDRQRHLIGQRNADRPFVVELDRDHHAVLQEGGAVADEFLLQFELLVAFGVHENQRVALLVEEGEILLFQPDLLDGLGRAEALVELGAVDEVLQFDLIVGAALAGLHMIGPDRHPEAAIVLDDVAGTDFVTVDFHLSIRIGVGKLAPIFTARPILAPPRPQIRAIGKRKRKNRLALSLGSSRRSSSGKCSFSQRNPIADPVGDGIIIEIIGRIVQARRIAIAEENKCSGAALQHIGKVLSAHYRRHGCVDGGLSNDGLSDADAKSVSRS